MARVVILGCGWLGTQLGIALAQQGHQVWGSRRSPERLAALPAAIRPLLWDGQSAPYAGISGLFADSWLILAMPPAAAQDGGAAYLAALRRVLAGSAKVRQLVLCSSSSVYAGLAGVVAEADAPGPDPRAAVLWQAEQAVLQQSNSLVLRLAGLVGPGRHPAAFTRRGLMAGADVPVNLVHSADICQWLLLFMATPAQVPGRIVNLCAPLHANKSQFYQAACLDQGKPAPQFTAATEPARQVDARLSLTLADFQYRYADTISILAACQP